MSISLLISLIPLIPFIGFLINGLGFKRIPKTLVPLIGTGASLLSFLCVLNTYLQFTGEPIVVRLFDWISIAQWSIGFSFQIDQLSLIMLFVITGVGTLIHGYSAGYMKHDEGYGKFFAYLNLFLFSMILLVLGGNYLMMFIGWEGVGLCSYLLIGFWNSNTNYANAARKAFIMNRIGDLGFLIGIFLLLSTFGTLEYGEVFNSAKGLQIGAPIITAITLALFVGAMGKSAQIPLFTWLPDAMAGPTPVSALIHAATMVTSGIYMIVRSNVLYTLAPFTLEVVAWVGLATALLGALIGLYQNDIKKVLAYSTVSQLGYMFIGLGVMAYSSGLFHVITHAFFKALLFLGAGSVIHAMSDDQDIRNMGGLWSKIKITAITFLIGTIAISGIPPFAGFFSKDEILAHTFEHNKVMWILAVAGSFLTAFYMFRLFFVTFTGKFRGTEEQEHHLHESPSSMTIPLIVLAGLSIIGGFIGMPVVLHAPHYLNEFLSPIYEGSRQVLPGFGEVNLSHSTEWMLMGISVAVAVVAILLSYNVFGKGQKVPGEDYSGLKKWIYDKFYIDEAYNAVFVNPMTKFSTWLGNAMENTVFGGIINGIYRLVTGSSGVLQRLQTGNIGTYIALITLGVIIIFGISVGSEVWASLKSISK
ncbi:NADH dehydrogenase subunit L [Leadbetterella byssophila DSM 17132]|uniref:NADH dehydrogenase subunit L n=1 Tax=Leadbetterella byssophila (strain DSM 17132 / JCM 16389 / KACC 11308 / NBRC 106382 / 4M15) TaxID=649349 RepID=E4RRB5_LEAB4|nr:NADH-quinone oxidoreductase subunit L [Leadbetterella byssophila]ADQ18448.1 NADH dehydrogenase subunit L [Leadbetterella byssophila DSM 17132]